MKIVDKLKNIDKKTILLFVLVIGIISMTIAFSVFTSKLNLNGIANVARTSWNIHFDNEIAQKGWLNYGNHLYYLSTFDDDGNGYVNCNMIKNESLIIDGQCYEFDAQGHASESNTCGSFVYNFIDTSNDNWDYEGTSSSKPNEVMYIKTNAANTVTQGCVEYDLNGNYFCADAIWDCTNQGETYIPEWGYSVDEYWVCPNNSYVMQTKSRAEIQGAECEFMPTSGYLDCTWKDSKSESGAETPMISLSYATEDEKEGASVSVSYYYVYNSTMHYGDDEVCYKTTLSDDTVCVSW